MSPVSLCRSDAVAALKAPVVRILPARTSQTAVVVLIPRRSDAVRPGVISADGHAACSATLYGKHQPVIAGRAAAIRSANKAKARSTGIRVRQCQPAALVPVSRRRAGGIADSVERAWAQS